MAEAQPWGHAPVTRQTSGTCLAGSKGTVGGRRQRLVIVTMRKLSPYTRLEMSGSDDGTVNVVIETPRGCRNKYKFDEELGVFRLNSVLPAGAVFPFDFGYVAGTLAEDGDPLDVLLIMEEPVFTGCVVRSRLIGALEAEQTDHGKTQRNDRLLAVACDAHNHKALKSAKRLDKHLVREIKHFFESYNLMKGRRFRILGFRGPKKAARLMHRAQDRSRADTA
jgi:inorganic pyrophosphatase